MLIKRCELSVIELSDEFPELLVEYVEESSVLGSQKADVQWGMYHQLENAGVLYSICAFEEDKLIGFLLFILTTLPHYGLKMASTESYFVSAAHRKTGAGLGLLKEAEMLAKENGAVGLLASSPKEGRLADILPNVGYKETHRVFYKALQ